MRTVPVLISILALALTGCGGPAVGVDDVPTIDYENLRTFRWAPWLGDMSPEADQYILEDYLIAAMTDELADKGYRFVRYGTPDFLIAYHVVATTTTEVDEVGISPAWPMPYRIVDIREEATLILDIIDPWNGAVIWRGWAIRGLGSVRYPDPEEVRSAVSDILAEYPSN